LSSIHTANQSLTAIDIASGRWKSRWCGGRGAVLESPVTGWAQDGCIHVLGIDRG
jgi:hypothetical protein